MYLRNYPWDICAGSTKQIVFSSLFGLPYLPVGLDESTTDIEGPLIRQVLYKTDPRNNPPTTNSANGTSSIALDVVS